MDSEQRGGASRGSIGEGAVIGAGSVVTKDVEPFTLSYGNPCRCVRKITAADKVAEGLI